MGGLGNGGEAEERKGLSKKTVIRDRGVRQGEYVSRKDAKHTPRERKQGARGQETGRVDAAILRT